MATTPAVPETTAHEQVYPHERHDIEAQDLKTSNSSDMDEKHVGVKELNPELKEGSMDTDEARPVTRKEKAKMYYKKYKVFIFVFFWMVMTG